MNTLFKASMVFFMIVKVVWAENTVLVDPAFPYRIIYGTGWVQDVKNDSTLRLKTSAPGKKTRFQLQKYVIDTSRYDSINRANLMWSRLSYVVNKELATKAGQVIWVDSTANKKLGNYRAFELIAYYSEKSTTGTLWWAEYSRWTDHNGFGYLASIIGDTNDIMDDQNYASYKALMDSVSLSHFTTVLNNSKFILTTTKRFDNTPLHWYNVLGRNLPQRTENPTMILMNKNSKRCLIR
jgi:hypothetical protein